VSGSLSDLVERLDVATDALRAELLAELPAVLVSELLSESSDSSDIDRSPSTSKCCIQVNTWSGRGMHSDVFDAVVPFESRMAIVKQDINPGEGEVAVNGVGWFEHKAFEQDEG
jgi:hypothetical protein